MISFYFIPAGQLVPIQCSVVGGAAMIAFACSGCGVSVDYASSAMCKGIRHSVVTRCLGRGSCGPCRLRVVLRLSQIVWSVLVGIVEVRMTQKVTVECRVTKQTMKFHKV